MSITPKSTPEVIPLHMDRLRALSPNDLSTSQKSGKSYSPSGHESSSCANGGGGGASISVKSNKSTPLKAATPLTVPPRVSDDLNSNSNNNSLSNTLNGSMRLNSVRSSMFRPGSISRPSSTMPAGNFTQYSFDTAKVLKEYIRRRDDGVFLRVMPKAHAIQQHVLQEIIAREQTIAQEASARIAIQHKFVEERSKRREQQQAKDAKQRLDELRQRQSAELTEQKNTTVLLASEMEKEIRERLRVVQLLQPKLNPINAALADVKNEQSDCAIIAQLLEEDRRLSKALKADARFNTSKTADVDGGAIPHWTKHCVASSFNVAAILQCSPLRASVQDAPTVLSKNMADRKVIVVHTSAGSGVVAAWAHTRFAMPDVQTVCENFLALPAVPDLPAGDAYKGVLWLKEDCGTVTRAAKAAKSTIAAIADQCTTVLSAGGISSHELSAKDITAIGESHSA